ncbi:MAG: hypothetical protein HYV93_19735 [Candidatus Rokubacteria bacterium]|nr:hypothetical protein [Candidatus Rokubacteria bacterium]
MTRILTIAAVTVGLWAAACSGQSDPVAAAALTADPSLVRGAAAAPVTIIEFSDYQ